MTAIQRRQMLRASGLTVGAAGASRWFSPLARALEADPQRKRRVILLWMAGGPSQTDTFDLKPGHENGGPFQEIQTPSADLRISEHLPGLARMGDRLAVVRGLSTKEGDHSRGTQLMRTGHPPTPVTKHPAIGAALAKELTDAAAAIPGYVSIAPSQGFGGSGFGPGYLGPRYAPLYVTDGGSEYGPSAASSGANGFALLKVESIQPADGITAIQTAKRLELWKQLQTRFVKDHPGASPLAHQTVYKSAVDLMQSDAATAFDLDQEDVETRTRYGKGAFGQGCLMARRLIEQGVSFVEVSLGGWDTHSNNFEQIQELSGQLDAGWTSLMRDLDERGLLDLTTILWMGEFGRTPQINSQAGRDHFPQAWSCVFAGGGIEGGQAYGRTSNDGRSVEDGKVGVTDVLATLCSAVGVDPRTMNQEPSGRPLPIVDGQAIQELLS